MNASKQYPLKNNSRQSGRMGEPPSPAELTLRLIAGLPAPVGLEGRVEASVRAAAKEPGRARLLSWPAPRWDSAWMRGAAAAAIVFVVVGGGWGVYSRVQPAQQPRVIAMPRTVAPGGFSNAGAMRTPQTLNGPVVTHPAATVAPPVASQTKPARPKGRKVKAATAAMGPNGR